MCNKCVQVSDLTVYIFIVIVLVAIIYSITDWMPITIAAIGGTIAAGIFWQSSSEHLESIIPVTNSTVLDDGIDKTLNINLDDDSFSEYKNISLSRDIDTMEQRRIDLDLTNPNQPIDNSDIVESASFKFSSNFQPNNSQGITSTSSAYHSGLTLGEREPNAASLKYTVPLNDAAYDLDESLARGQQHRSSINKRAIDGAVRSTKNVFQKVFTNELNENAEREWWSSESTDFETDYHPYY